MSPQPAITSLLACVAALSVTARVDAQEYRSSVVGTEFDVITEADPDAFERLEYAGQALSEMPDKRGGAELRQQAFVFDATFRDGAHVRIFVDSDFGTEAAAREEALRYTPRLGRLPAALRMGVERLVVHRGGESTTAFSDVGLIVLYSDNATKRIATHDLEETIFHESVHASWDRRHARSDGWRAAQRSDGAFVTKYARENPDGEDLAESALFGYALARHPERIPEADTVRIRSAIPARLAFVASLLAEEAEAAVPTERIAGCRLDPKNLETALGISDILSNALHSGLAQDEPSVRAFLATAKREHATARELVAAAARRFDLDPAALDAAVVAFRHCNCHHAQVAADPTEAVPAAPPARIVAATDLDDGPAGRAGADTFAWAGATQLVALLLGLSLLVNVAILATLLRQSKRMQALGR